MRITNGLEALMSYDSDGSSVDSDMDRSSYKSSNDSYVSEHENSLTAVMTVISELLTTFLHMQRQNLAPFNVTPLITLMNDITSGM